MTQFKKVHAERLLTLAWFLRTQVEPEHFDLAMYMSVPSKTFEDWSTQDLIDPQCGTTACAIGWCPVVFPNACRIIEFYSYDMSTRFFGIDNDEWNRLFSADHARTPKQEARVIEQFVKSKGWVYA